MNIRDIFSTVAISGGVLLGLVGILGMRVFAGASIMGRWPVGWREWGQSFFLVGSVKVRRFQLLGIAWFFGCGLFAFSFILRVMLYGQRAYGWQ
ncbi:hypothetical protein ACN47A_12610 [Myxococcus fulvus]|uniref:hypothetical protein n=1 Tax=Myxococcus fulvus TaxID=33 RepID=UPI003B992D9E